MATDLRPEEKVTASSRERVAKRRTPAGYRVLHVIVPEQAFNHVKAQSFLSGMRFPEYLTRLLKEAGPYPGPASPLGNEHSPSP